MTASPGPSRRFRDRARARRDGRRDGHLGIPTQGEIAYPPALMQITQRAEEALAELARRWAHDRASQREQIAETQLGLRTAAAQVNATSIAVGTLEQHRAAAIAQNEGLDVGATNTSSGVRISGRVYVAALIAILIAEFPLNAIAFRLFGEAEVLTWVMTASLAVTLVLCAHGLGTFLRVAHPSMTERRWIVVLAIVPMAALIAIAVIRARYLSMEAAITGLQVIGPIVGSVIFLVINLLVYTGATMLSYLAHAPEAANNRDRRERAGAAKTDLVAARRQHADAGRRAAQHEASLAKADGTVEESSQVTRALADQAIAYYRQLMAVYSAANLRARGNPEMPAALREPPQIQIPSSLCELPASPVASILEADVTQIRPAALPQEVAR